MVFGWLERRRRRRILKTRRIDPGLWGSVITGVGAAAHLDADGHERLRDLASLFLHDKAIEAAGGVVLTDPMRVRIAAEACVPVLNLDLDCYDDWYSIIVYPGEFITRHEYVDEAGVVHSDREDRLGEAWDRGPVVVSWDDIEHHEPGTNVIVHEMAHKLDMGDGDCNGMPPLHRDMDRRHWAAAFTGAYDALTRALDSGGPVPVDPYAAEDPCEFFAVVSEAFFETPGDLFGAWPDVYQQLSLYYRQDPGRFN